MSVAWISPSGSSRSYASGSLGLSPTRGRKNWLSNMFPQPLAVLPPLCQAPPIKSRLCKPREQETGETEQWSPFPSNPKASKVAQYEAVRHRLDGLFFAAHDMDFPSLGWFGGLSYLKAKGQRRGSRKSWGTFAAECFSFPGGR